MLVALVLAMGYEPLPILNMTCPATNLTLSLNCSALGIYSTRDCECACLALAACYVPRCAYSAFTHDCARTGNCVDKCVCRDFLCSYEYTPQATTDYWADSYNKKREKLGLFIIILIVSMFGLLSLTLAVSDLLCGGDPLLVEPLVEPPDDGISDE